MDVNAAHSPRAGLAGLSETLLRRFKTFTHALLLLPLYSVGCLIVGTAVIPGLLLISWVRSVNESLPLVLKLWTFGAAVGGSYLLYGFSILLIVPLTNWMLGCRLTPWRGPYYSLASIRWYIHNGATYIVRYSFLEFVTPTPFNLMFYRLMGMTIGEGTIINSTHISDPSLITLGKKVTLGGSCTIVGHYGQGGFLVLAPVKIGDYATIGLRATIMGGVKIGEGAKILPNSVVLPKTVIPDGETWGGVPAQRLGMGGQSRRKRALKAA
ncbi:MAG: hypothetical protein AB7N80_10475 [Bdellovibrionales bacterium]